MAKGQKSNQAIKGQQSEPRRGKNDQADKQGDRSERDQLDDRGRQRHIGHGDQAADQGNRRPLEEGDPNEDLGRPVRVGPGRVGPSEVEKDAQARKDPGQWEDKTEGTSRP
jgi:hypothetical protein